jgi:RNA polymerase sigma factor (sigma-70 family)
MHGAARALGMPQPLHLEPLRSAGAPPRARGGGFDVAAATRAAARGDAAAFELIYRLWFARVLAFARALTKRDESFCLDITQDVMLRAARRLPVVESEAELGAWFARVCVSAAVDMVRRESRRRRREHACARPQAGEPVSAEELGWLRERMSELAIDDQALIMQRLGQGLTLKQAGASVGISEQAAHGRVRRALAKLRAMAREVWRE